MSSSLSEGRLPGSRLGPYEIVARIGMGGMGEVYRARDGRLDRDVALKLLPEEFASDQNRLRRFEREARAVSTLNHPNIVTVFEVGEFDSRPYIAMELVEGQTLRQLIRPGGLPFRKLLDLAVQIAEGLARAHEAGIVHRDLKPENVMVSVDGVVKVLDFGLAKLTRSPLERGAGPDDGTLPLPTRPGVLLGTVRYMSPEQASGAPADFRSDQFSFGAVLYEMVTGSAAFQKGTTIDTLSAILHDEPEPLSQSSPKLPVPLRWILERCLAKDPKDRYASTQDLARDLVSVRQHLSEVSGSGETLRPARLLFRPRWLSMAAGGAGLAAVGLLAGFVLGRTVARDPPLYRQLTFRAGVVASARFGPDEQTIYYSASWERRPLEIFVTRLEVPESRPFGLSRTELFGISRSGEMALGLNWHGVEPWIDAGLLARMGMASLGAPRQVLEEVSWADWSPDGRALAIIREVGGRSRLEYPIGRVLYEETAGFLTHPRISRDGERVAFLDHPVRYDDAGGLAIVDRSGKKKTLVSDFLTIWGLSWSPKGKEIWFTGAQVGTNRALYAATPAGGRRLISRVIGSTRLNDISSSGRVLLTQDQRREHVVALAPGEAKERELSWLDYSLGRAISDDGRTLLFVEGGEGAGPTYAVFLRRTDGSPATRLGDGDAQALSRDGKSALAILRKGGQTHLVVYPTGPGAARVLPATTLDLTRADFLPDGKRVLLSAGEAGRPSRLYLQSLQGGSPRAISPDGYSAFSGSISPDGKVVVARGPGRMLYLFPLEAGKPTLLATLLPDDVPCGWSEEGRLYVASSLRADLAEGAPPSSKRVDLLDVTTGARRPWKELGLSDGAGAIHVTPDGRAYTYSYVSTQADLYLADGLK